VTRGQLPQRAESLGRNGSGATAAVRPVEVAGYATLVVGLRHLATWRHQYNSDQACWHAL